MSKQFRSCNLNQAYLLPPSLDDWLPEGHLARFVAEVVETLDLSEIYATYEEGDGRGLAAYDPRMMVRLLIYGYCRGVAGWRRIERATHEDVAFRYWAADQHPDRKLEGIDLLVAPDRLKHGEAKPCATGPPPPDTSVAERMRHKLRTVEGRAVYQMRKAVVDLVFGQIKERRGFRRFL